MNEGTRDPSRRHLEAFHTGSAKPNGPTICAGAAGAGGGADAGALMSRGCADITRSDEQREKGRKKSRGRATNTRPLPSSFLDNASTLGRRHALPAKQALARACPGKPGHQQVSWSHAECGIVQACCFSHKSFQILGTRRFNFGTLRSSAINLRFSAKFDIQYLRFRLRILAF